MRADAYVQVCGAHEVRTTSGWADRRQDRVGEVEVEVLGGERRLLNGRNQQLDVGEGRIDRLIDLTDEIGNGLVEQSGNLSEQVGHEGVMVDARGKRRV